MNSIFGNYKNDLSFDQTKIDQLIQLGNDIKEDVVSQLIELHFATSEICLNDMENELKELNFSKIKSTVHKLKSSCGTLGLNRLHSLCDGLENYIAQNKAQMFLVKTYVDCIAFEYNDTKKYLWQWNKIKVGA
ncbi:MAG: Hpt domain-containing protein [Bdellovibrio sp.]|nr:Hpt domain-containing protein [Bdellovibrio sp.]